MTDLLQAIGEIQSLERRNAELTARIAELEALAEETEEPIHICGSTRYRLTWGGSEMAEVTGKELWEAWTQLTEARKDGQRLDWLLEYITQHGTDGIGDLEWTIIEEEEGDAIMERASIAFDRPTIDRAMHPEPKEGK